MKNKSHDAPEGDRDTSRAAPQPAPESAASRETFPERRKKPGAAGLANEPRPGLGTRMGEAYPPRRPATKEELEASEPDDPKQKPRATPRGYEEPRPEPREQTSDSRAAEEERDTGVSGHSSGD